MMPTKLEVCIDDAAGLEAAVKGGADRVELCSALDLGGLTPSAGLMALAARIAIPSMVLVRPRAGDFVYLSPDLAEIASPCLMMLSPGVVDQDVVRLSRQRKARLTFPFDPDFSFEPVAFPSRRAYL